jgi:hypothetical protein
MTTTTAPGPSCKRGDVALELFPDSNLRTAKLRPLAPPELGEIAPNPALHRTANALRRVGAGDDLAYSLCRQRSVPARLPLSQEVI